MLFGPFLVWSALLWSPVPGSLSGTVVDGDTQRGVAYANVVALGERKGVITDARGAFRLRGLPAGPQLLDVLSIGYERLRGPVLVVPGETESLRIVLNLAHVDPVREVIDSSPRH